MIAIFHGTSWLNFLERMCLFGFYSTTSGDWKKEMGAFTLPEAFAGKWCHIEICLSLGDPGLHLLCHRNYYNYKSISLTPKGSGSYNEHQGSAQLHLLSLAFVVSHIAGDQPSAGTLGVQFWCYLL